jgi:hypothetical protein
MSTAEARLEAVAKATALLDEALALLDEAEVRNGRVLGMLMKARTECSTHERELTHIQQKHEERKRECRRSAS